MKYSRIMLAAGCLLAATPATAGFFDGAGAVAKQMKRYVGRPAQELVDALGDATDQKEVLNGYVISGGFDADEGPSCTWKINADKELMVKSVSVFGNPFGCGPVAKDLKRYIKAHPIPGEVAS